MSAGATRLPSVSYNDYSGSPSKTKRPDKPGALEVASDAGTGSTLANNGTRCEKEGPWEYGLATQTASTNCPPCER